MSNAIQMNAAVPSARSFYARVAALGFGLIALAGFVALIASTANGDPGENLVFSLVFVILGLLVAAAVWRSQGWALILAALLSLALLGLVGPFSLFSLSHPEYAGEFVPVLLLLAGAVLGLVGSVISILQSRRKTFRPTATSAERLALGALLSTVAVAVLISLVLTITSPATVSAEAKAGAVSMQFKNYQFTPSLLQAKTGETVRLIVKNDDASLHTFTLPALGVNVTVPPGSERIVEFKAPGTGSYQYYCIPHAQESGGMYQGMVGTLQVQ